MTGLGVIADLQEWLTPYGGAMQTVPRTCGRGGTDASAASAARRRSGKRPAATGPSRWRIRYATDRHLPGCDPRTHGGTQGNVPCPGRYRKRPGQLPPPPRPLACKVAVSPWRGLYRWAVSGPAQAGQAQVGGAQITNPIVTGGSSGPAEYLGGDIGDTSA